MTVQAAGAHRAAWMVVLVRGPGATLLVRPHWIVWTIAVLVAASAATVVYRYTSVDVGRLRPLPDMHGPTCALPGKRVRPGRDRGGKSVCAAQVHSGSRTSWSAQNKETKMIAAISQSLKCRRRAARAIDNAMAAAAIVHPATAAPQVIKIYETHNAVGVAPLTWLSFMAIGTVFLAYGLLHMIKPMIVTQVLWFVMDAVILTGVVLYS
jgi:uncharacterized protein with PQ loop repeat